MYKVLQLKVNDAKENLKYLIGKYKIEDGMDLEKINNIIEDLLVCFNTYAQAPKFVLTRALYVDSDGRLESARFVVRPSVTYALNIIDMKKVFTIVGTESFFDNFIYNILEWFDSYTYYARLEVNTEELNYEVKRLIIENNLDISVRFTLGDGIKDITDSSILIGLNESVLENLSEFSLFSTISEWRERSEKSFVNLLKECARPYDIFKIKNDITDELGIYKRKSISKLIRQIINRRIDYVRVGVGYSEDSERFAVVEREAIKEEDISVYDLKDVIITENMNPTVHERKECLTKIVTYFRVLPFHKKTGVTLETNIEEFLEDTKVVK